MTSGSSYMQATPRRSALTLGLAVAIAGSLLALVHTLTAPAIESSREALQRRAIAALLPPTTHYDNDPLSDRLDTLDAQGTAAVTVTHAYRARLGTTPTGAVLAVKTDRGYNGTIELLVGIDAEHRLRGVRVIAHRETPGLGDAIDADRSNWIDQFDGLATGALAAEDWSLVRDGGRFDGLSGASITAKAVVHAVGEAVHWHRAEQQRLFAAPGGSPGEPGLASPASP